MVVVTVEAARVNRVFVGRCKAVVFADVDFFGALFPPDGASLLFGRLEF